MLTIANEPHTSTIPTPAPTTPDLNEGAEAVPLVIRKGKARAALAGALLNAHRALYDLEAVAAAIARELDAGATVTP